MSETTLYSILFAGVGAMFIGISIPLIQERVQPNGTYGFRTRKTLSDPKIWYAANRASGHDLLAAGCVITAASVVMIFAGRFLSPGQVVFILLAVMVASLGAALVNSYRTLSKL